MIGNIYITGLIGTFLNEKGEVKEQGVELIDVIMQVKNQPKAESFKVYINSEGGVFTTGYEIYNYLKGLGKPIHTIGQGLVASMATVVFAAGSTRELRPGTAFHPHLPSGGVEGNSDDIQNYASLIKDAEKAILKTYKEDVGLEENEILPILRKDKSITAEQAYKLGFATVKPLAVEPVAYFKNNNSKNDQMSNTKKKSVWDQFQAWAKGKSILNKVVFTADQKELDFYELEDDDAITVGAKARIDGEDATGEVSVPSEENPEEVTVYVFESGAVTEIKEPEEDSDDADPDSADGDNAMTALQEENARLKTQLQEVQNSVSEKETTITSLKEKNKTYKAAIQKIKALESEEEVPAGGKEKPGKPETEQKASKASKAIANLKKRK